MSTFSLDTLKLLVILKVYTFLHYVTTIFTQLKDSKYIIHCWLQTYLYDNNKLLEKECEKRVFLLSGTATFRCAYNSDGQHL